jgi:hypothetical protein
MSLIRAKRPELVPYADLGSTGEQKVSRPKAAAREVTGAAPATGAEARSNLLKQQGIASLCRDSKPFGRPWHLCCDSNARSPRQGYKRF